mmetsp:Transcript_46067/g.105524  ORF Transcript_46067/g.105524 Transcript_46067/m.105524 type:complete len:108 (+) Transcript_46067:261-584(+)
MYTAQMVEGIGCNSKSQRHPYSHWWGTVAQAYLPTAYTNACQGTNVVSGHPRNECSEMDDDEGRLSKVAIYRRCGCIPLEVLPVDEGLYSLLEISGLDRKLELLEEL